jgi:mRNA-degrading endonuclease RelE of RelBE toxin-antitoxin system
MPYELYISPGALKELKTLDSNVRDSIKTKLKLLALDPFDKDIDITQLKGKHQPIYYRIKSGDYRVIYHIENKGIYVDRDSEDRKKSESLLIFDRGLQVPGLRLSLRKGGGTGSVPHLQGEEGEV